jgi:hypothetical protein
VDPGAARERVVLIAAGPAGVAVAGDAVERPVKMTDEAEWEFGTLECAEGSTRSRSRSSARASRATLVVFEFVAEHSDAFVTGELVGGGMDLTAANGDHSYATYEGRLVLHPKRDARMHRHPDVQRRYGSVRRCDG